MKIQRGYAHTNLIIAVFVGLIAIGGVLYATKKVTTELDTTIEQNITQTNTAPATESEKNKESVSETKPVVQKQYQNPYAKVAVEKITETYDVSALQESDTFWGERGKYKNLSLSEQKVLESIISPPCEKIAKDNEEMQRCTELLSSQTDILHNASILSYKNGILSVTMPSIRGPQKNIYDFKNKQKFFTRGEEFSFPANNDNKIAIELCASYDEVNNSSTEFLCYYKPGMFFPELIQNSKLSDTETYVKEVFGIDEGPGGPYVIGDSSITADGVLTIPVYNQSIINRGTQNEQRVESKKVRDMTFKMSDL